MNKTYYDENGRCEFDFLDSHVFQYHEIARKTTLLSDVDFVVENSDSVMFLEYKNASVLGASNPDAFGEKMKSEKFYIQMAKKFFDSLFMHWACNGNTKDLPITYSLIIEHPEIDGRIRRKLREKVFNQLPFKMLSDEQVKRRILDKFEVLNIDEWNDLYPSFKAVMKNNQSM